LTPPPEGTTLNETGLWRRVPDATQVLLTGEIENVTGELSCDMEFAQSFQFWLWRA
jgi:hypothetical protein